MNTRTQQKAQPAALPSPASPDPQDDFDVTRAFLSHMASRVIYARRHSADEYGWYFFKSEEEGRFRLICPVSREEVEAAILRYLGSLRDAGAVVSISPARVSRIERLARMMGQNTERGNAK